MPTSSARSRSVDPTIYPVEVRVGESMLQRRIVELLRPLLEWWLNIRRGVLAFVGAGQFIYWRQYDPQATIAPDLYVIPGIDPNTQPKSWKLWLDKVVPSLAIEVVSDEWEKDYRDTPGKYDQIGVRELVVFDPEWEADGERLRWQVFRRVGKRGLSRIEVTDSDRVQLKSLGCWLRVAGEGATLRLRIAEGPAGELLVPTAEEREEAERAAKEAERAAKEAALAEKEAALAKVRELERQLKRSATPPPRAS
jgi:Uma2 family endonuclease